MNMVLEIRLYQNSRSFIWGTVTHSISLIPLSAPKCMLSSHLQGRKAPQTSLPSGAEWAIPQAPQTSPKLEAQIPAIRAEGGNIMPGNTPGPAASRPGASLRSFLLLRRSLFLGVVEAGWVLIKGESEIGTTCLIFNSNKNKRHPGWHLTVSWRDRWEGWGNKLEGMAFTSPWGSPSSSGSPWMLKDLLVCCCNTEWRDWPNLDIILLKHTRIVWGAADYGCSQLQGCAAWVGQCCHHPP